MGFALSIVGESRSHEPELTYQIGITWYDRYLFWRGIFTSSELKWLNPRPCDGTSFKTYPLPPIIVLNAREKLPIRIRVSLQEAKLNRINTEWVVKRLFTRS